MIELTFLKELMLIRQPNVCNRCHDYQLLKKKKMLIIIVLSEELAKVRQ